MVYAGEAGQYDASRLAASSLPLAEIYSPSARHHIPSGCMMAILTLGLSRHSG